MKHYLRYTLKILFGFMIIIALDVMLKKVDPFVGDSWLFITLVLYTGYCYIDYRIEDKD
jgi:predicted membrane channel-forming protein YqfA (hemolysin III family)